MILLLVHYIVISGTILIFFLLVVFIRLIAFNFFSTDKTES